MPPSTTAQVDHKRPGAYAVSTETTGEPLFFSLPVPAGVEPGSTFTFMAGDRRGLTARCPPTSKPGDILQVALSPEPQTHYTPLNMSVLTTTQSKAQGGAKPMTPHIRKKNQEYLEETADTFVVIIPLGIQAGQQFVAQTPRGERFLVSCPPQAKGGDRLRLHTSQATTASNAPQQLQHDDGTTIQGASTSSSGSYKLFQIKAPKDVRPNQVLPVLVCGKRVPITLPKNVVPGQTLTLKLPVEQVVSSIALEYGDPNSTSNGWCRTIRLSDLKFQWVNNDAVYAANNHSVWKTKHSAFCRKLITLEGNDPRLRTGTVELVPASQVGSESELKHHHKTLMTYATVAHVQTQSLDDKVIWFQNICSDLTTPWESGRIKLVLRREQLLSDSVKAVLALSRADLRKRWRLEFVKEPALDSGGVMREWFQLISEQLFNPDMGLWLPSLNNQVCMRINPASDISCPEDHLIYFRFLGRVMGRALFDRQLIQGHMVRHLYKHVLGWPITFDDLRAQDEEYYQSLKSFTTMEEDLSVLCLDFTLAEETLGVKRNIDLVPGGTDLEVTSQNLPQYLEAILKYRMLGRTKPQITELLLGFFDVIPEPALTVFDPNELELIMCGLPTIDMDDWESHTNYSGSTSKDAQVVKWFWQTIQEEFTPELRARLLQFVTGSAGVPSRGFSVLQGNDGTIKKFAIHGVDRSQFVYPRAHTCFNRLDLPNYTTREELYEKLKAAVTLSAVGFDME